MAREFQFSSVIGSTASLELCFGVDEPSRHFGERPQRSRSWSTDRHSLIGHLGLGYGYRPNGAQAGFRLGAVAGMLFHFNDLAGSSINGTFPAALGGALQNSMDAETNDLPDAEPYAEVAFSWLF